MKRPSTSVNKRFGRFALVGAVSTAIDFSIYLSLAAFEINPVVSSIISSSLAFIFSFTANKKYTFKTSGTNIAREMILFVVFTLIGLWGFQSIIIHATVDSLTSILGNKTLGLVASKLLATTVSLMWNYITYSRIVFKHGS